MAHSMSSQREQYKESTKLDGYALDLRCLPNVAVWLNSNNNKAITEKQDKELFKKKKQAFMKILLLNTEKAFTYVSLTECTICFTSMSELFTKVSL